MYSKRCAFTAVVNMWQSDQNARKHKTLLKENKILKLLKRNIRLEESTIAKKQLNIIWLQLIDCTFCAYSS